MATRLPYKALLTWLLIVNKIHMLFSRTAVYSDQKSTHCAKSISLMNLSKRLFWILSQIGTDWIGAFWCPVQQHQMTTEKKMLSKSLIMQMFQGHVQNGGDRTNRSKPFYVIFFTKYKCFCWHQYWFREVWRGIKTREEKLVKSWQIYSR